MTTDKYAGNGRWHRFSEWLQRQDALKRQRQANGIAIEAVRQCACSLCGVIGHSKDHCDEVRDW